MRNWSTLKNWPEHLHKWGQHGQHNPIQGEKLNQVQKTVLGHCRETMSLRVIDVETCTLKSIQRYWRMRPHACMYVYVTMYMYVTVCVCVPMPCDKPNLICCSQKSCHSGVRLPHSTSVYLWVAKLYGDSGYQHIHLRKLTKFVRHWHKYNMSSLKLECKSEMRLLDGLDRHLWTFWTDPLEKMKAMWTSMKGVQT